MTFLVTDEQVLDEGFLELINNILTTGIVPAIFEKGEKNQIIDAYKPLASKLNLPETKDTAYNLFVQRIRENLHMIISMSPSGDNLRNRCRNFPGLISSTTSSLNGQEKLFYKFLNFYSLLIIMLNKN